MTEFLCVLATFEDSEIELLLRVNAANEQEARQKFMEHHAPTDEALKESIFGNSKGHDGLLGNFLCDEENDPKCVEKNVYDYFGPQHEAYAQIYLKHIDEIGIVDLESQFPLDMVIFMALERDWYRKLTITPLNEIEQI